MEKLTKAQGEEVARDIVQAYRPSTRKQQEVAWRAWQDWLIRTGEVVSKSSVLRFLRYIFHTKRLAASTTLCYRAALAFPLSLAFGIEVEDKEFSLLARSQFLARPPQAKTVPSWDVSKVLKMLESPGYEYGMGNRTKIINKALFLLALASGSRVAEMAAWYRPGILWTERGVAMIPVRPGFLFKNQRSRRPPPTMEIKPLTEEGFSHPLCPSRALRQVLGLGTREIASAVFTAPSGKGMTRGIISSRLCHVINEACPGTFPRAHDVRKVAASIAWTRGVAPTEILRRGFWSSLNTFIEHYLVPVSLNNNAVALMSNPATS